MSQTSTSGPGTPPLYTGAQRAVALVYGVICHLTFAAAVAAMMTGLYTGMTSGLGPFRGWSAALANGLLLLQFGPLHSFLLSKRGRSAMRGLAPLNLGGELLTTLFAILASLQVLAVFLLWSPSGIVWFSFDGPARAAWTVLYCASWLLLLKSMHDSGLALQTGLLGWYAVFRGRRPEFRPFAQNGLYRFSRQPIYVSYALILWTGPTWTPDHAVLTLVWTAYCVVGAAVKEQRYRRIFGAAFQAYQAKVPFWLPRLRPAPAAPVAASLTPPSETLTPAIDCDVLIAGAGPVGLLLALLLSSTGRRILVVEQRPAPPSESMAIGVTPPSLDILGELGLADAFVSAGIPITRAVVHEDGRTIGDLHFSSLPGTFRYVLSIPQSVTLTILTRALESRPNVSIRRNCTLAAARDRGEWVEAEVQEPAQPAETIRVRFLAGCDGVRSRVREITGIPSRARSYGHDFLMADVPDESPFGSEAHLFFGPRGSVESFPLPGGLRRWIVLLKPRVDSPSLDTLVRIVTRETGHNLCSGKAGMVRPFSPRYMLCDTYHRGRIVLCGDAAHAMSPIGGQGMNTGFADAEFLAHVLSGALDGSVPTAPALDAYTTYRREAFKTAARRAARGMWVGTRTGWVASRLRHALLISLLRTTLIRIRLAPYFAMLTIPFNRLHLTPWHQHRTAP